MPGLFSAAGIVIESGMNPISWEGDWSGRRRAPEVCSMASFVSPEASVISEASFTSILSSHDCAGATDRRIAPFLSGFPFMVL
ncbi:hypothetical protein [Bradyrhizobium genosp. P]|uniref:hypothetical protein n=1 Tax=Bradyrhizobium genosp. P TaxID=83641 RepID=UPI003CE8C4C9